MQTDAFFQEKVYITPTDLQKDIGSVDEIILNKLKMRLEQRCSPHGFVLPGTLELLTRSAGMVDSGRFSGDWAFLVKAKGQVLNPPEGSVVSVEVLKNNKMGIYAVYENAIRLMVPRDLHLGDEEFDQLKVGEMIKVEIQKSRFQLHDPFIVSVGIYRGHAGAPDRVVLPKSVPVTEEAKDEEEATEETKDEEEATEETKQEEEVTDEANAEEEEAEEAIEE
jgi:DNA-directed RNA polymerase subunit E'/Rpb7